MRVALAAVDSTNAEAARRAPFTREPTWIIAEEQTGGRGRRGRPWSSPRGNFYATLMLHPSEPPEVVALRSFAAALALRDACVALTGLDRVFTLKWPNDVLLGGAKAAGILSEAAADDHGGIAWLSLGFGVNLTHAPQVPGRATACLADAAIVPPAPEDFAAALLAALQRRRTQRAVDGFAPIRAAWLARGPASDTHLALTSGIAGRFAGLAEDGSLLLASGGRIHAVASGEVA